MWKIYFFYRQYPVGRMIRRAKLTRALLLFLFLSTLTRNEIAITKKAQEI